MANLSHKITTMDESRKEFQTQANEGTDPDVKAFAAKTLPTLQVHLEMARETAKKVSAQ